MKRKWIYPADGGEPFEVATSFVPAPRVHVRGDIQPYRSMVTGEMIESRSQHRAHLKQHGKVEIGNEMPKPQVQKHDDSRIRELHQVFTGYGY